MVQHLHRICCNTKPEKEMLQKEKFKIARLRDFIQSYNLPIYIIFCFFSYLFIYLFICSIKFGLPS